jgi:hypothetical protein
MKLTTLRICITLITMRVKNYHLPTGGMAQMMEHLLSKHKALSSNLGTAKYFIN